ncbi:oligopeptide ABC transporter, permease protein [Oceanicola granulosus HTCC2516]|uniref:Oligopeptide ABC transporter, permease protein n=1 Tax=Oceanicola granulosus (strain ATCC BAA-861 / DSM 15982 / KCTC 12143 / HTCC2516) TaxID=314256 RepID=Q2CJI9_OCEGH|nr:ABC transporter permease [Oceanicola granulosus]EAR53150.1 oligopeptide ABC transporter, permease protein [Oceanicola granulosus HTCC2516]
MRAYLIFALKRLLQLAVVVFAGVSAAFVVAHFSPISPIETIIGRVAGQSSFSPTAVESLRQTLTELFGYDQPLTQQYLNFWSRFVRGDLGPSLIAFPTPAMELVMRALPWTVGLLTVAIIMAWLLGNILGGLAGYYQNNRPLKAFGIVAIGIQPIPYYIIAFLLVIIFGYLWPVLPISGGFAMAVRPAWSFDFIFSVLHHAILPALSLVLAGIGTWFLGMRALVSNIVTEDYVTYAELGGVNRGTIVMGYVTRNALIPQLTALAMALGGIFSGTIITEQVFSYPGLGTLLIRAVNGGDTGLVLAVSCVSVIAVASAIFIIDLLHPLLDPRVKVG